MSAMPFVVLGDPTTTNGKVVESCSPDTLIAGKPVARSGDKAVCPKHDGKQSIKAADSNIYVNGRPIARHQDKLACGCQVLETQHAAYNGGTIPAGGRAGPAVLASLGPEGHEYNDRYRLVGEDGQPFRRHAYAVEYPDGSVVHGITDDEGHTELFLTGSEPTELHFYVQGAT
jgi:uncharacterized Zn-binding protein involved in type VI secretion